MNSITALARQIDPDATLTEDGDVRAEVGRQRACIEMLGRVVSEQRRQIRMLRRIATDEVPHLYEKDCPALWRWDENGCHDSTSRDPSCVACRILMETDADESGR